MTYDATLGDVKFDFLFPGDTSEQSTVQLARDFVALQSLNLWVLLTTAGACVLAEVVPAGQSGQHDLFRIE